MAARSTGSGSRRRAVVERVRAVLAARIARAEAGRADRPRQRADRRVAVVLYQHDHQLDTLRDRGHELARQHQVRAVADHHEHLALGRRELDPDPAGDLVAHARVAILDVVALRVARAPQLVQVARHRSGGAHHDIAGPAAALTAPITSAWLGSGSCRRCTSRSTSAPQAADSSAARCSTPRRRGDRRARPAAPRAPSRVGERASPLCLAASSDATLTFTNRTPGSWNADFDDVVKSLQRVPTPITRSASRARRLAAGVPVAPIAPSAERWSEGSAPRPACVSPTGMPVASASARERVGRLGIDHAAARHDQRPRAERTSSAARSSASGAGG